MVGGSNPSTPTIFELFMWTDIEISLSNGISINLTKEMIEDMEQYHGVYVCDVISELIFTDDDLLKQEFVEKIKNRKFSHETRDDATIY